jgi:hypothetical protein
MAWESGDLGTFMRDFFPTLSMLQGWSSIPGCKQKWIWQDHCLKAFLAPRGVSAQFGSLPPGLWEKLQAGGVYQILFFTHPALNFMENKTEKTKTK